VRPQFLEWANGPDSVFETNDCLLRPAAIDNVTPDVLRQAFDADPFGVTGRFTLFYRRLDLNTAEQFDWLVNTLLEDFRDHIPNGPAVVFVGRWSHWFKEIDRAGNVVVLRFWAWGEAEDAAMTNLHSLFDQLHHRLRLLSDSLRPQIPARK
jgi:hypothetical protein